MFLIDSFLFSPEPVRNICFLWSPGLPNHFFKNNPFFNPESVCSTFFVWSLRRGEEVGAKNLNRRSQQLAAIRSYTGLVSYYKIATKVYTESLLNCNVLRDWTWKLTWQMGPVCNHRLMWQMGTVFNNGCLRELSFASSPRSRLVNNANDNNNCHESSRRLLRFNRNLSSMRNRHQIATSCVIAPEC